MCGIVSVFGAEADSLVEDVIQMASKIRHRGPDWSGIYVSPKAVMAHERLCIIDPAGGKQPLKSKDGSVTLVCNGEIYNYKEIREELKNEYEFLTESDCEVILALYKVKGIDFLNYVNGMFAFTLYDEKDFFIIARDHLGIIPLYIGYDNYSRVYVASELKALEGVCKTIENFKPGHYYCSATNSYIKWYNRSWTDYQNVKDSKIDIPQLWQALELAVKRQLMSNVPFGVLLSGGLDSSIICALAKKYFKNTNMLESVNDELSKLHSFTIGLVGSPDLYEAQRVAQYIGTRHHSVNVTVDECLNALRDVIYHLESYDVTTVRASTPMYLLARYIKSFGLKMVLSGEGADEIFGGYLYFHKAPNAEEFHKETLRKLDKINLYDCLRANKALSSWGVEGRFPFLDVEFVDVAMQLSPEKKMPSKGRMEKWILREASGDLLPNFVKWRQKEQFSDGVGYSWIDTLKNITSKKVTDDQMLHAEERFPINPPHSKEEYYYRSIFEQYFPSDSAALTVPSVPSVACCTSEALNWDESFKNINDPSGRVVDVIHESHRTSRNVEFCRNVV